MSALTGERESAGAATPRLLALLPVAALYYAVLLLIGTGIATGKVGLLAHVDNGLAFNSMLEHMLRGRFDVDPAAITYEGMVRDGRTYAYFGVFVALLRLPFSLVGDLRSTDFTVLSCLIAAILNAGAMLAAIAVVWRALPASRTRTLIGGGLVAVTLFAGPEIAFLKPSIYQEVILWADALAAAFVCCALHGLFLRRAFSVGLLTAMAVLAGLCLNTRVTMAIGLYGATGLIVLRTGWIEWRRGRRLPLRLLAPLAVLGAFAALCGVVNYERWGNPFTFLDLTRDIGYVTLFPERLVVFAQHGAFNPARILYGLIYYFLPIWAIRGADGHFLFDDFQRRFMDSVELPPASFLVNDALLIALAVLGLVLAWRRRRQAGIDLAALGLTAAALAAPALLILSALGMTFRYRGEFYPLLDFAACAGFFLAGTAPQPAPPALKPLVLAACVLSVLGTHLSLALYDLSAFGSARDIVPGASLVDYYRGRLGVVTGAFAAKPPH